MIAFLFKLLISHMIESLLFVMNQLSWILHLTGWLTTGHNGCHYTIGSLDPFIIVPGPMIEITARTHIYTQECHGGLVSGFSVMDESVLSTRSHSHSLNWPPTITQQISGLFEIIGPSLGWLLYEAVRGVWPASERCFHCRERRGHFGGWAAWRVFVAIMVINSVS